MSVQAKAKATLSLRLKLLLPLLALITVIFALSYIGIKRYISSTINNLLDEETASIIDFTTACLNVDELDALTTSDVQYDQSAGWPQGMTDPRYWEVQKCLEDVDGFNPRAELFTYYAVDDKTLAYGVDQWATLAPDASYPFREIVQQDGEDDYAAMLTGLKETYHYPELKYSKDDDVYYYATITPLKNSAGKSVGALVISLDANWVTENLKRVSNILLSVFALIYALVALLVWAITRNATSQLTELKAAASRVADGNYTPISLKPQSLGDEVSTLAELFNIMLDKVRGREETLKQEVVELKIQIDMEKRSKDVKEIVDTEFFKELKERAANVRKQRQEEKEENE
jgi:HAMP domain-containing protein